MKFIKSIILLTLTLLFSACTDDSIRIASYNMAFCRHGADYENWEARKDLPMQIVHENNFDICAVQEPYPFQVKYLSSKAPEYALAHEPFGDETPEKILARPKNYQDRFTILCNMNNPIWYKRDKFDLLDKGRFWYSDTPEKEFSYWKNNLWDCVRNCEWAKFRDKKTQKVFYVFNTHLYVKNGEEKEKATELLLKKINEIAKDQTFFIFGDFNSQETTQALQYLLNSKKMNLAKNVAKNIRINSENSYISFKGKAKPSGIIDHIFVSKNVDVKYFEMIEYKDAKVLPSDHLPIFADVIIK